MAAQSVSADASHTHTFTHTQRFADDVAINIIAVMRQVQM